jgi:hypothetical protein
MILEDVLVQQVAASHSCGHQILMNFESVLSNEALKRQVPTLLFKPDTLPLIRSGSITVTRRNLGRQKLSPGSIILARASPSSPGVTLKVKDITKQKLGDVTYRDMHLEGCNTVPEYRAAWEKINKVSWNPDQEVYMVRFEVVT